MAKAKGPGFSSPRDKGTDPNAAKTIARSRAMINKAVGGPAGNVPKPAMPARMSKGKPTPKSMRVD